MVATDWSSLPVSEVMHRWPETIGVFIDLRLYCIGCPIGQFHTAQDVARAHGISYDRLVAEVASAIAGSRVRGGPARDHRRSAAGDGGP
jgi:hybrid cluster-associated redox disulfide protein